MHPCTDRSRCPPCPTQFVFSSTQRSFRCLPSLTSAKSDPLAFPFLFHCWRFCSFLYCTVSDGILPGPSKKKTTTGSLLYPDGLSVLSFVDHIPKPFWDFVNLSNTGLQNMESSVCLSPLLVRFVTPFVVLPLGLAEREILGWLFFFVNNRCADVGICGMRSTLSSLHTCWKHSMYLPLTLCP